MSERSFEAVRRDIRQAELFKGPDVSMAEHDPYSAAMQLIVVALEWALDDGISGAMNAYEFETLESVARLLMQRDPSLEIEPRPA